MICNMSYLVKVSIINAPVGISEALVFNVPDGSDNEIINLAGVEIIPDHGDKKRKLKCNYLSFLIVSY